MSERPEQAIKDGQTQTNASLGDASGECEYDLQENAGFLLRTANQYAVGRFNQYMSEVLELENVTTTQFAVLTSVMRFPDTTLSALSEFTSIDMPTLNSMINRLEKRELLTVVINPGDKRSRMIKLTPTGESLTQKLLDHGLKIGDFISEKLTAAELRRLKSLLRKLQGK